MHHVIKLITAVKVTAAYTWARLRWLFDLSTHRSLFIEGDKLVGAFRYHTTRSVIRVSTVSTTSNCKVFSVDIVVNGEVSASSRATQVIHVGLLGISEVFISFTGAAFMEGEYTFFTSFAVYVWLCGGVHKDWDTDRFVFIVIATAASSLTCWATVTLKGTNSKDWAEDLIAFTTTSLRYTCSQIYAKLLSLRTAFVFKLTLSSGLTEDLEFSITAISACWLTLSS